ncbi:abortive infection family protein, partial [Bradyrhizobium liaoningense]
TESKSFRTLKATPPDQAASPKISHSSLHSRVGKYVKALDQGHQLTDMSKQIIKNAIGVFEKFNFVRNNNSLAHDNVLPNHPEARFIFDSVTAVLRFIKSIEAARFGS